MTVLGLQKEDPSIVQTKERAEGHRKIVIAIVRAQTMHIET